MRYKILKHKINKTYGYFVGDDIIEASIPMLFPTSLTMKEMKKTDINLDYYILKEIVVKEL